MNSRITIVGAGVIGCSLAYELARRGSDVTLIDAAEVVSGTSSASFAWVNSNGKSPAAYSELNFLGLKAHERASRAGDAPWFHQIGNLELVSSRADVARLERKVATLTETGYEATLLTRSDVADVEPSLDLETIMGGVLYPREGWIDTVSMCSTLLGRAQELGVTYAPFRKVVAVKGGGVTTVAPDGTTYQHDTDVTVLTAGNGNREILANAGITFPTLDPASSGGSGEDTHPTVGLINTTGPVDCGLRHIIHADGISLRPARNGGVSFTDHSTGSQWDLRDPRIWTLPVVLLERARQLYPILRTASTETVTLGTRVMPNDGMTIADWITEDHSLYAVATHSGVTLAAHLAEVVADEVLSGARHASLDSFGLSRFSG
jgi:glycine/D-amino acid oxidase-like deaminating enzyme